MWTCHVCAAVATLLGNINNNFSYTNAHTHTFSYRRTYVLQVRMHKADVGVINAATTAVITMRL